MIVGYLILRGRFKVANIIICYNLFLNILHILHVCIFDRQTSTLQAQISNIAIIKLKVSKCQFRYFWTTYQED